jgi:hypothetical protein
MVSKKQDKNNHAPAEGTDEREADKTGGRGLGRGPRIFVLRSIAEYKTDEWIVEQLHERYAIERTTHAIRNGYRHAKRYAQQIQNYRDKFNKGIEQEPFYSKRYLIQSLHNAILLAQQDKDWGGAARLYKQLTDITGHKAPEHIEHNLNITGGATYEHKIENLLTEAPKPPPGIAAPQLPMLGNTIEIKAQPVQARPDPSPLPQKPPPAKSKE